MKGFESGYPGIYVPSGKTLTIQGNGSLNASSNGYAAGIGGGWTISCGNIVIEGGNITATGGNSAAGIGGGNSGSCGNITITSGVIYPAVTGVSLPTEATLNVGQTLTLTPTISPADATDKSVTWTTSNASVATVDANGVVTAQDIGTTTITVTTTDGAKTATCTITVDGPIIMADGTEYTRTEDFVVGSATYTKTLGEERVGKFQAWLVPFDYTLTDDDLLKFSFYKVNMIANAPDPSVDASDEMWVFLKKLEAGDVLRANMPYVYKPLEAVTDYEFTTDNATLKAKNTGVLMKTETAEDVYSFYASYGNTTATADAPFYYVAIDGTVCYGDAVTLGSLRWFIRKTSKYGDTPSYARQMHFFDGESETTGISTATSATETTGEWYTLDGRRMAGKPAKSGIYVKDGQKVIIK